MTQPAAELQPSFERYRDAIGNLEKTVGQLGKKTDDMEKQGQQYFNMFAQQADANAITARQSLDQLAEALRNMSSALYPAPSPDSTT